MIKNTLLILLLTCSVHAQNIITRLLTEMNDSLVNHIISEPDRYKLQIIYTVIDRNADNSPVFTTHTLHVQNDSYFYPASTVKFPAALLAFEKVHSLDEYGVNKYTRLSIDSAFPGQTRVLKDATSETGFPSIAHYAKKIFIVSDNDAYNRLYEFLGQEYFNKRLKELGYKNTTIFTRLALGASEELNRNTNPFHFYNGESVVYTQLMQTNPNTIRLNMKDLYQGTGYLKGDSILPGPFDFSNKNYFALQDQHTMLLRLFFPAAFKKSEIPDLTEDDYNFLYTAMSRLPRESSNPVYAPYDDYHDGYVKYFMYGDTKDTVPPHIRIFNKVGLSYGYLTENAYIIDTKNNIEFFLSAVIHVNDNQIFNDGVYEYDSKGFPFLGKLGRCIYQHELKRKRERSPDLSRFIMDYSKWK